MDFSEIVLSDQEVSLLKDIRDGRGTYADAGIESLIRKGLVSPDFLIQTSNAQNEVTPDIVLTNEGYDYLTYLDNIRREKRNDKLHNWLIAIFSVLGGLLLSDPLRKLINSAIDLLKQLLEST